MAYILDRVGMYLSSGGDRLPPASSDSNPVGFCARCDGELRSVAYYRNGDGWLVAASCQNCGCTVVMSFDGEWNWLEDCDMVETDGLREAVDRQEISEVSSLPMEQLVAVFTKAEIRDLIACGEGRPFVRQNLYRARNKYDEFERLFGIRIGL